MTDQHEMRMVAGSIRAVYTASDGREYYIVDGNEITIKEAEAEYPYHVEVHTRRDGCHLEDVCDDYRTREDAEEAAVEMSKEFAGNDDYYCQITRNGDVIAERRCSEWTK